MWAFSTGDGHGEVAQRCLVWHRAAIAEQSVAPVLTVLR